MPSVPLRSLLAALALSLGASSCILVAKGTTPEGAAAESAKPVAGAGATGAAKAGAAQRKAEKRAHDLELARVELALAELDAQFDERSAATKLDNARRALEEARLALEHFKGRKMPRELEDARLDLDRSEQNRVEAEQELHEMEETYAKDQFALTTKELVLLRHRKRLEFATRNLAMARDALADKENVDLPRELRELERKARDAEEDVKAAEVGLQKTQLKNTLELARKRWAVGELERPDDDAAEAPGKQGA